MRRASTRKIFSSIFAGAASGDGAAGESSVGIASDAADSGTEASAGISFWFSLPLSVCGFFTAAVASSNNSMWTSEVIVGILHLAAICSAVCTLARTNSTCLEAAGDLASGRIASTGPMTPIALCTSCRPAIGMAQCGSILTTT